MGRRGSFIVLEGLDGSGKTCQAHHLAERLAERDVPCLEEREPSTSPVGQLLRAALERRVSLREETLALLFAADRFEHIHAKLLPALEGGQYVVCDRYVCSSLAYQGVTNRIEDILAYNRPSIEALMPDLTIYLDTNPEECLRRIEASRGNRDLFEEQTRLCQTRNGFEQAFFLLANKTRLVRVDGNQDEANVARDIWLAVEQFCLSV